MTDHQFSLFGYQRPRRKVPISAADIEKAKAEIAAGNGRIAEETLRNIRYKLDDFEKRIR